MSGILVRAFDALNDVFAKHVLPDLVGNHRHTAA